MIRRPGRRFVPEEIAPGGHAVFAVGESDQRVTAHKASNASKSQSSLTVQLISGLPQVFPGRKSIGCGEKGTRRDCSPTGPSRSQTGFGWRHNRAAAKLGRRSKIIATRTRTIGSRYSRFRARSIRAGTRLRNHQRTVSVLSASVRPVLF